MARKPRPTLSKKTRFEVFKRDGFACQYCGATPPGAVLHVDHIHPLAEGGTNTLDNLITACESCNAGKGARLLSTTPESLTNRASELAEREEQLRAYQELLQARSERLEQETWQVAEVLEPGSGERGFNGRDLISIRRFIERLGVHAALDAAGLAYARVPYSEARRFKYFCGVCWGRIRDQDNACA